jgi:hypothetical protein
MPTSGYTVVVCSLVGAGALALVTGCATSEPRTGVASPNVAFAATELDLAQECSLEGSSVVVAAHVMPMAGVNAQADASRVWLHFATRNDSRAALAINPSTMEVEDEDGNAPRDLPTALAGTAKTTLSGSMAVDVEGGRRLIVWTHGSADDGRHVRMVTLGEGGVFGNPVDLGFEGSAIGRPAVAMTASGQGVVAFEESYGGGFHLVASRVVCNHD